MRIARVIMVAAGACGVIFAAGGATAATAAPNPPVPAAASGSWSQTDYNAALSRANLNEQILTRATVGKVRFLRSLTTSSSESCHLPAVVAPVLTGGRLYAMMANDRLTKYNPATGKVIWQVAPDPSFSTDFRALSVAGGLVVVGEQDCGSVSAPRGLIQAFNAATGALVWSAPTPQGRVPLQHMVVSGKFVIWAGESAETPLYLSVRRLTDGSVVWESLQGCGSGAGAFVVAQRVISDGCDPSGAPILTASNIHSGALTWSRPGNWGLQRGDTDAPTGRHLYATDPSGAVVSLSPLTGKTQYQLPGATTVLVVTPTQVFADCGALGVCAYSITSGSREWNAQPGSATALAASAGGVLYLDQGLALNTRTGKTLATLWAADSPPAVALAVGNGQIAAATGYPFTPALNLYGM